MRASGNASPQGVARDDQQQRDALAVGLLLAMRTRRLGRALDVEASHLGDATRAGCRV
jgi:hypothetical protein